MSEFDAYEALKRSGASAEAVYRAAHGLGMGDLDAIRMLRAVFGLSLRQAKEAMIVGSGTAASLDAHEAAIARELDGFEACMYSADRFEFTPKPSDISPRFWTWRSHEEVICVVVVCLGRL